VEKGNIYTYHPSQGPKREGCDGLGSLSCTEKDPKD
jgi:hypothetical protein